MSRAPRLPEQAALLGPRQELIAQTMESPDVPRDVPPICASVCARQQITSRQLA
jgi:hypothetical protein